MILKYIGTEKYIDPQKRFELDPGDKVEFEEKEGQELINKKSDSFEFYEEKEGER